MTHYQTLLEKVYEINDIQKAAAVLSWDKETNMPPKGLNARIQQLTTLSQLAHRFFTSDEFGEALENAATELNGQAYESNEASLIRVLKKQYDDARKQPPELVKEISEVSGHARAAWSKARATNDFDSFEPWLAKNVVLNQKLAELFGYEDEPYDALLDKYETGMKTADVRAIFDASKAELVPLLEEIAKRPDAVSDAPVHQSFPIAKQKKFAHYIAEAVGYDFDRGHLGTVVHPFATSFSRDDSRITTRWYDDFLNPSLFGTLHESGHAMYEQGTAESLARTPLARGTSLGIHESQSRMMENLVGRSRGFWQAHYPKLQEIFPDQLTDVSSEAFYHAINKVHPSFIRVEADEMTYNFHIILRFELEQAMLNGELDTKDLPTAWRDKMKELLGVVPETDSEGCLQDVHWTRPGFGYFPTYALGNMYASQIWETAVSQHPEILDELNQGQTMTLLGWLRENIHQHGRKFTPSELIVKATGQPLTHEPFIRYIKTKFSDLYGFA